MKPNILLLIILVFGMYTFCSGQTQQNNSSTKTSTISSIEVYYFHYTRRCATCNAVENVTKDALNELYGNKVTFAGYNLDKEAGKSKGKELEVSGQSLIIVAGNSKIDITNDGFINARSNPDKLKAIIKEKIDALL